MSERIFGKIKYEDPVDFSIETALEKIEAMLVGDYAISKRGIGLLLLQEDESISADVRLKEGENFALIQEIIEEAKKHYSHPLDYIITVRRQQEAGEILSHVTEPVSHGKTTFAERLSRLMMQPLTGIPILLLILYWGLYKFVGEFGAGTVVGFIEGTVFEKYINPFVSGWFIRLVPWHTVQDLFVGEYGMITLGIRYAVALILPIVAFFFFVFSIIEDTGYLPRLAMLIDRLFKKIGLSGRAVIPMVLGFGCDTMATMVTRTLPTKRERIISTMLLALAVPCSAQIGVIIALLEGRRAALFIWTSVTFLVFLFIGFLAAQVLPGERPSFYMEVPPLRFPKIYNVLVKTYVRIRWYFIEVLPVFVLASFIIWLGQITGLFNIVVNLLKKPVVMMGLPPEAAKVFLFGFFRRDYGAAGLFDMNKSGALNGVQLVVACIALTLFLPCVAQFLMNVKERGLKTGLSISAFTLFFSFTVAFIVNYLLVLFGVVL